MQGLVVSARAWCWVSKHRSQWQGWSDNMLVPAAGSWAQHRPSSEESPRNWPRTPDAGEMSRARGGEHHRL